MESRSREVHLERSLEAARKTIAVLADAAERSANENRRSRLHQNVALEAIVARKTEELERERQNLAQVNAELRARYGELARMEIELRQAQKLEAVGRLAAGVAHEINTPIQFVSDSLHFIRNAFADLSGVVERYRALRRVVEEGGDVLSAAAEAADAETDADAEYTLEHVPKALDRATDGLTRVATIVRSMREFAHPDRGVKTLVDLNQAIRSTLTIASNEYKYVADVVTDLGDIPRVQCHGGEVNQVVLNLVVNAAHAIADAVSDSGTRGTITVRTREHDGHVEIDVADSGVGIPDEIRAEVFDPFFTTKEVGRGTGQGLAIARSVVVDKHGGTIRFDSKAGHGTTFFIRLPVRAVELESSALVSTP